MADIERDIVLRVKSETEQAQGQFKTLKQELRSIENELNKMAEAGQSGTEAFNKLQQRAGEVKDQIGDTKAAIKALSSDTFRLDAFAQGAQGIAGGFAAAQGALALFGTENKQVEEAIKKTQGAMALLQGVTAITNLLQKESALMLGVNTVAQKVYAFAVGTSTGAMKAFRIALMTTGILAVVGAIVMAADALGAFSDAEEDAEEKIKKTNEALKERKDALDETMKSNQSYIDRSVELVKVEEEIKTLGLDKEKNYKRINELQKQAIDLQLRQLGIELETKKGLLTTQEEFKLKEQIYRLQQDRNRLEIQFELDEKARAEKRREREEKQKEERQKIMREREEEAEKNRELVFSSISLTSTLQEQGDEARKQSIEGLKDYVTELGNVTNAEVRIGEARKQIDEDVFKTRQANINKWGKLTIDSLNAFSELNNALSKKDEASQRNAFERNKKFSIAQALISTFLAVNGALTAGGNPVKLATGAQFVEAGIALTTGLAQVAKITKTQFQGGSTSGEGGGISAPSIPGVNSQPSSMSGNTPTIGSTQLQLDAQGNLQQGAMRTYVLETDISDKQKRSQRLRQTSTLGK
jgi:hypothetical protein